MSRDLDAKVRGHFCPIGRGASAEGWTQQNAGGHCRAHCRSHVAAFSLEQAYDIGFHLTDWNSDAAFLVALILFPERFDAEEIAEGVEGFLIHAPNHVAAAAKLFGYPIEDIFGVDALSGDNEAAHPKKTNSKQL